MISCVLLKPKQPLLFIVFSNISQTFNCSNELIFVVIISRPQKENNNREINVSWDFGSEILPYRFQIGFD